MTEAKAAPGTAKRDEDEEPPLDPAAEKLRRKLTRLLIGSFGIMGLGFVAVFIAILYRTGVFGEPEGTTASLASGPAGAVLSGMIPLGAGERIVDTDLDGVRILLRVQDGSGAQSLILFDSATGRVVGRYGLQVQPPRAE
jgi:hypothetical protein